ncbi:MAG: aromatic ring-hydroxylating dioxygenase subunit alpha [Sphingomonadales bacterium]|nr:aromatic ring-hydroxylating dioxygenase subunit alpha [Sphingomonadales bacterium]
MSDDIGATAQKPRYGAPLASLSPSQIAAIRSLPSNRDVKPPVIHERRPVGNFVSDAYWSRERETIFRNKPVAVIPSAALPDPGSVLAHDGYGIPLLITRDRHGTARIFLNACTHKGAMLVEDCAVKKWSTVSCPFHAWTFGLDGRLIGVPREETLCDFDKKSRPLAELPCHETGGIIWGILNPRADADFSLVSDQITDDLTHLGLTSWTRYGYRRFEVDANWKLVMEPFLEGYHVQRLHINSIGPQGLDFFDDIVPLVERFGSHIRQISGRGKYQPDVLDDPAVNIRSVVTIVYNLFPNTVVITSPYYISVMILMPTATGKTNVDYYMLTETAPDNPKAEELYARSFAVIQDVFGNEDFKASETCQRGLETGAIPDVIYTGMEEAIPRFYEGIEAIMDEALEAAE